LFFYYKASYLEARLEDASHAAASSNGLPAKQARLVTKCPVDAVGKASTGAIAPAACCGVVYYKGTSIHLNLKFPFG